MYKNKLCLFIMKAFMVPKEIEVHYYTYKLN